MCVCSGGGGAQPQPLEGSPQEEKGETAVGRVLSLPSFPHPLPAAPSPRMKFLAGAAWSDPRSCSRPFLLITVLAALPPILEPGTQDSSLPFRHPDYLL